MTKARAITILAIWHTGERLIDSPYRDDLDTLDDLFNTTYQEWRSKHPHGFTGAAIKASEVVVEHVLNQIEP